MQTHWVFVFLIYFVFLFLFFMAHTITISISAFFQFQLKYPPTMIENWVYDSSWYILIFAKAIALGVMAPFLLVKSNSKTPIREIFLAGAPIYQKRESAILIVTLALFFIFIGKPSYQEFNAFSFGHLFIASIGTILFYFPDYLILFFLFRLSPITHLWQRALFLFVVPLSFYLVNRFVLSYGLGITPLVAFHLIVMMFLGRFHHKGNWVTPFLYLLCIVAPLSTIFGNDPFSNATYSLFKTTHSYTIWDLGGLLLIIWLYEKYRMSFILKIKERWRIDGSAP